MGLEYFKSKEFLISLIYVPILIFINLISGQNEIIFAIISVMFVLILLGLLINLIIRIITQDTKLKIRSFFVFFISSVLMLFLVLILGFLLINNCSGGLCGLSQAEVLILFVPAQIFCVLDYGTSLLISHFLNKKK